MTLQKELDLAVERLQDWLPPLLNGKRILLTGSSGFLGRYFGRVLECLANAPKIDYSVVSVDNGVVPSTHTQSANNRFSFVQHDITQPFPDLGHFDLIINAAGIASPFWYAKFPLETLNVGIKGLQNMLELSAKNKARMLFFSSSEIYGTADEIPTPETYVGRIAPDSERSIYDLSKSMGEAIVHTYNRSFGADAVICRPFNFYGSWMNDADARVLPAFRQKIREGKPLTINSSGNQTRSFCHIVDALDGCFRVLLKGRKDEAYNIGNRETEVNMWELVCEIEAVFGRGLDVQSDCLPSVYVKEPLRRCPDITKAQNELGYSPKIGLEKGLWWFFRED